MSCFDWICSCFINDRKPILHEDPHLTVVILSHTVEITHVED